MQKEWKECEESEKEKSEILTREYANKNDLNRIARNDVYIGAFF